MTRKKPDPVKPDEEHRESQGVTVDQDFRNLLEASSLGSPTARRIRSLTPAHVAEELRQRAGRTWRDTDAEGTASPCQDAGDSDVPANQAKTAFLASYPASGATPRSPAKVSQPCVREITDVPAFYESVAVELLKALISRLDKVTLTPRNPMSVGGLRELIAGIKHGDIDLAAKASPSVNEKEENLPLRESGIFDIEAPGSGDQVHGHEIKAYSMSGLLINATSPTPSTLWHELAGIPGIRVLVSDSQAAEPRVNTVKIALVGRSSTGKPALPYDSVLRIRLWSPTITGKTTFLAALTCILDADYESVLAGHSSRSVLESRIKDDLWTEDRSLLDTCLQTLDGARTDLGNRSARHEPLRYAELWRRLRQLTRQRIEDREQRGYRPGTRSSIHERSLATRLVNSDLEKVRAYLHSLQLMINKQGSLSMNEERLGSLHWKRPHEIGWQHHETSDVASSPAWDPELLLFRYSGHSDVNDRIAEFFQLSHHQAGRLLILDVCDSWLDDSLPGLRTGQRDVRTHGDVDSDDSWQSPSTALSLPRPNLNRSRQLELSGPGQQSPAAETVEDSRDQAERVTSEARNETVQAVEFASRCTQALPADPAEPPARIDGSSAEDRYLADPRVPLHRHLQTRKAAAAARDHAAKHAVERAASMGKRQKGRHARGSRSGSCQMVMPCRGRAMVTAVVALVAFLTAAGFLLGHRAGPEAEPPMAALGNVEAPNSAQMSVPEFIAFAPGQDQLSGSAKSLLRPLASQIRLRLATIDIRGFTDPAGGPSENLELAQARAQSVATFLEAWGVPSYEILTRGMAYSDVAAELGSSPGGGVIISVST